MIKFETIDEFMKFRKTCLFCDKSLTPSLHTLISSQTHPITRIKVWDKYRRGFFNFNTKDEEDTIIASIDCKTNEVSYKHNSIENPEVTDSFAVFAMNNAFHAHNPHVEMSCNNKECKKYSYYYSSTNLKIVDSKVEPIELSWESFNLDNSWVQNDWTDNKTRIYSTDNPDSTSISIELMPFDSMTKDKLIKRIKTIITFS